MLEPVTFGRRDEPSPTSITPSRVARSLAGPYLVYFHRPSSEGGAQCGPTHPQSQQRGVEYSTPPGGGALRYQMATHCQIGTRKR